LDIHSTLSPCPLPWPEAVLHISRQCFCKPSLATLRFHFYSCIYIMRAFYLHPLCLFFTLAPLFRNARQSC
jgi:hypothetical protein